MNNTVRILGIAPYEGMQTLMQQIALEFPKVELIAAIGDLDRGVEIARNNFHSDCDIIISRGGTAQLLRQKVDIPVVEIPISEYDILRSIRLVENVSGSFAIVGFPNIIKNASYLSDIISVETRSFTINNANEADKVMASAWDQGYRTVLCDVVATEAAKRIGMNAMLITSGSDSIRSAFQNALQLYDDLSSVHSENLFLREIIEEQSNDTVVFDKDRKVFFSTLKDDSKPRLIEVLSNEIDNYSSSAPGKFIKSMDGFLYTVKVKKFSTSNGIFTVFYISKSSEPFSLSKSGIKYYSHSKAKQTYYHSIFSCAGDILNLKEDIQRISQSDSPVLLYGETGTGKESVANIIYNRGRFNSHPFISINCALLTDKSWDYIIFNHNSPFTESQAVIYISQIEALSAERQKQLLALLIDTDVCKRNKLILSCTTSVDQSIPDVGSIFADELCCLVLRLPALHKLKSKMPALIHLYLNQIIMSQITDVTDIEESAVFLLQQFAWPHNLSQFKRVLLELVTTTSGTVIQADSVKQLLESEAHSPQVKRSDSVYTRFDLNRSLEEMEKDIIKMVLNDCNGNQSLAAGRLGISRTTLWRLLK